MKPKRIVVMGFVGSIPIAGVTWQHLHYIVGLQRLGHEVYYIEDSERVPYNPDSVALEVSDLSPVRFLSGLARAFGFEDRWAFRARFLPGHPCSGMTAERVGQLYREADAILNVCGAQEFNEDLLQSSRVIYVESDPGVQQIKLDTGEESVIKYIDRHHKLFTFGENVGTEHFPVPLQGRVWIPTRQPVVTDFWTTTAPPPQDAVFTSIANWSTKGLKDIEWRGSTYWWSKTLEFLKFVEAPLRAGEVFELATQIKDDEARTAFEKNNWRLVSPHEMSKGWDPYRRYVQASKGEFTVAKDQYIRLNTGWFSDRSACYLAAGRPVITQETGFTRMFGKHPGLFSFQTLEEVVDAVEAINADYARHSKGARELALEFFEAETVLKSLLDRAGI